MMTTYEFDANLPTLNRQHLTLVKHTPAQMQLWVHSLPVSHPLECGKLLYQTLTELSTLNIEANLRFELVEILYTPVMVLIASLEKSYTNLALVLPIQGRRALALAQTLRHYLALNYKITAMQTFEKLKGKMGFLDLGRKSGQQLAATSVQRVLNIAQQILLDCYRQYEQASMGLWVDAHNLARLAQLNGVFEHKVTKSDGTNVQTVKQAYLALVLFAGSQANKLRPNEIENVYYYSQQWADFLELKTESTASLLVCNKDDNPPRYHHLIATAYDSWYIGNAPLVAHLRQCLAEPTLILPRHLLFHLLSVWSEAKDRMFVRRPVHKSVLLSVGMSSAHYYISNQVAFSEVVKEDEKEEIEQPKFLFGLEEDKVPTEHIDAWQLCYGNVDAIADEQQNLPNLPQMTYMPYRLKAIDRSPAGQKLVWSEPPPVGLRVGEAIALSEERDQGWGVGVLHWIQQKSDKTIEVGVEILAAEPKPCGVCLLKNNKPSSAYMRAFLIPEMLSVEQPPTLMTLNAGLTIGSMVRVRYFGQEMDIKLTKLVLTTQSLNQFEYTAAHPTDTDQQFDPNESLWKKLNV